MYGVKFKFGASGRAIGANFGWLVADKMMRLVMGLLVSAWVARYLGPEEFGLLAYSLTFIAIFQAIALLGLDNLIVRDVSADSSRAHIYLGTAIRLRGASAALTYILMLSIAAFFNKEEKALVLIAVAGLIIFFQVSDVVDLWFQSQLQSRRTVLAKGISYLLTASIKIALILGGAGLIAFAAAAAIEAALALVAMWFSYSLYRTSQRWIWSNEVAVKLLTQSWPLLLSGLSIMLYMRVGVIFLREFAGNAEVGIYTVGTSLSELWYFIPMAVASSIAPYASRKRIECGEMYQRLIVKAFSAMWLLSVIVAIFNVLTSKYWIALIYGEQFRDSAEIFAIHTFTFIPVCLGVMQSIWLINEGKSKLALYQAISGAIFALTMNFFLTPRFGAYGTAAATLISQFVQAFFVNALLAKDLFRLQVRALNFRQALRQI